MCTTGDLSLHTAFSRENPDGTGARVYVQRRIREQAALIAGLIVDRGANILVSGSAKQMPRDVREAFRDALAGHEKVDYCLEIFKICVPYIFKLVEKEDIFRVGHPILSIISSVFFFVFFTLRGLLG